MTKGEFGRIESFLSPLTEGFIGAHGLKDDVSCLPSLPPTCVTTDTLVEGVHFWGDEEPEELAHKLFSVNVSDVISKGCTPSFYWLNLSLPSSYDDIWWAGFCHELSVLQKKHSCVLAGGDSVAVKGAAVLSMTMMGTSCYQNNIVTRLHAQVGDVLAVTGYIGDARIGLDCAQAVFDKQGDKKEGYAFFKQKIEEKKHIQPKNFQNNELIDDARGEITEEGFLYFLECYRKPTPFMNIAPFIAKYAHASMDVSDGLIADVRKMCSASNVGGRLVLEDIPFSPYARQMLSSCVYSDKDLVTGGDDYQVVFTCSLDDFDKIQSQVSCPVTRIGFIQKDKSIEIMGKEGLILFDKEGYVHGGD